MTLGELKKIGIEYAKKLGTDTSAAELIIIRKFGATRTELIIGERVFPDGAAEELCACLDRFAGGEPIQYIVGSEEFMSLDFKVAPGVLIPRPETEVLVESLIEAFKTAAAPRFIDVGTGSGCIAVSLAKYLPRARITALDISPEALALAKENARINGTAERIDFIECDITRGFPALGAADCVVSNPPYIRSGVIPTLDKNVRLYESITALDGGEDGLDFYKIITATAPLVRGGVLAYEIGFDQGAAVSGIVCAAGFENVRVLPDLEGRDRVVLGTAGADI